MAFLEAKCEYSDGGCMPTRAATSRSVNPARPVSRAASHAADRISRRVASRRSASLSRLGTTTMIRSWVHRGRLSRGPAAAFPAAGEPVAADLAVTISQLSHRLAGRHQTMADGLDIQWTLTCGYGFCRTGRTRPIDLRIRRLGFESLRARPGQRPSARLAAAVLLTDLPTPASSPAGIERAKTSAAAAT